MLGDVNPLARRVQRTYLALLLGSTLAASFIWGVNTLFLLDAGLSNFEAFAANAFFSVGIVVFEVPTGVVADAWGRRTSFLLGTLVLAVTTFLYVALWQVRAPFWQWAVVSVLLGLGFTFFSGAVEAWLVDALRYAQYTGTLEAVFGRGQIVSGAAMLVGSVTGGVVAQVTSLGVPFLLRVATLILMFAVGVVFMHDLGFERDRQRGPVQAVREIVAGSVSHGLRNRPVRWLMLAAPFTTGVAFYTFYAMQPFLLELYGQEDAYSVAGLAAAIVAGSQILGGVLAPRIRSLARRRTTIVIGATALGAALLAGLGVTRSFVLALVLLVLIGVAQAAAFPVRQSYLNDLIPSAQRATVLSFDSLMGSTGGVGIQPALGRTADLAGYGGSYVVGAVVQLFALPLLYLSRREHAPADTQVRPS